jgi:NNP family nitrate/nitrite transporter-like MFS transporter
MSNLEHWDPEDEAFWESTGKRVATRNLWISIPSLLCGFAVWLMWGIITVQMKNLGFEFDMSQLFTLSAIAGVTGATLRIPSTFFIRLAGGRNTIFFTTALLMIPAFGAAYFLQDRSTPLWIFQVLAFLSGIGGGNFASSMSNISFFYPKRVQGYSLGMNAGLGNFGVTTMQILIPLCMTAAIAGGLSGDSMQLTSTSGTIFKRIPAGSETWLSSAGVVWLYWLIPLAFLGWFKMNNITTESVTPNIKSPLVCFGRITWLLLIGFATAGAGVWTILHFAELTWVKWIALPAVIAATVILMKALSPREIKGNLERQYKIFDNKHTWVMTIIYTMTFGSFIGFSAAVGLAIKFIFGFQHLEVGGVMTHDTVNANAPATFMFAWVGPFVGALIRPIGGIVADKKGGAIVTQAVAVVMTLAAIGVGYYSAQAYQSANPEEFFVPFFVLIVILFAATGVGNGSTFRTISVVFDKEQAGPALGWTSAVAAYGAFLIPKLIGEQMAARTPEVAMYGLAAFYALCAGLNWWYYLGPKADHKNP